MSQGKRRRRPVKRVPEPSILDDPRVQDLLKDSLPQFQFMKQSRGRISVVCRGCIDIDRDAISRRVQGPQLIRVEGRSGPIELNGGVITRVTGTALGTRFSDLVNLKKPPAKKAVNRRDVPDDQKYAEFITQTKGPCTDLPRAVDWAMQHVCPDPKPTRAELIERAKVLIDLGLTADSLDVGPKARKTKISDAAEETGVDLLDFVPEI